MKSLLWLTAPSQLREVLPPRRLTCVAPPKPPKGMAAEAVGAEPGVGRVVEAGCDQKGGQRGKRDMGSRHDGAPFLAFAALPPALRGAAFGTAKPYHGANGVYYTVVPAS